MTALLNGFGTDVGKEVFKAAGEGDWTAFLSVRRATGQDFPLVGLVRLYDFSLDGSNRLTDSQILASRQFVLLPALNWKRGLCNWDDIEDILIKVRKDIHESTQ